MADRGELSRQALLATRQDVVTALGHRHYVFNRISVYVFEELCGGDAHCGGSSEPLCLVTIVRGAGYFRRILSAGDSSGFIGAEAETAAMASRGARTGMVREGLPGLSSLDDLPLTSISGNQPMSQDELVPSERAIWTVEVYEDPDGRQPFSLLG